MTAPAPSQSTDAQCLIAKLRASRPYDGRHVTLCESRGGWKYQGLSGICTRLAADRRHMVLVVEHDPEGYWPIGMEILAEIDHETVPMFHEGTDVHCIDDKPNGIILNHNSDWSGEVRIAWYVADERRDPGPTPPSLCECWCVGKDFVAGRFTPTAGTAAALSAGRHVAAGSAIVAEPPVNVLTRAVALAVETYLRHKMEGAIDNLFIHRGKL
jgi:hypothetical protein